MAVRALEKAFVPQYLLIAFLVLTYNDYADALLACKTTSARRAFHSSGSGSVVPRQLPEERSVELIQLDRRTVELKASKILDSVYCFSPQRRAFVGYSGTPNGRQSGTRLMGIRKGLSNLLGRRKKKNKPEEEQEGEDNSSSPALNSILQKMKTMEEQTYAPNSDEEDSETNVDDQIKDAANEMEELLDALDVLIDSPNDVPGMSMEKSNEVPGDDDTTETPRSEGRKENGDSATAESESPPKSFNVPEPTPSPKRPVVREEVESIQERINRVKSGKMTEQEKEAFLVNALSGTPQAGERKPVSDVDEIKRVFSAPVQIDDSKGKGPMAVDSDQQKKAFLEMVTNPNRFGRYKSYDMGDTAPSEGDRTITSGLVSNGPESSLPVKPRKDPVDFGPRPKKISTAEDPADSTDLGTRLGVAAMHSEKNRKQALQMAGQARIERDQKGEQEVSDLARELQNDLPKEKLAATKEEPKNDEEMRRMKADRRKTEKERVAELMKSQEKYWAQKLAAEKAAKSKTSDKKDDDKDKSTKYISPQELVRARKKNVGWSNSEEKDLVADAKKSDPNAGATAGSLNDVVGSSQVVPNDTSMLGVNSKKGADVTKKSSSAAAKKESSPTPTSTQMAPAKKGPIRMELPLGDEDEEDDEIELSPSMSIADVMKKHKPGMEIPGDQDERSKKWGVDMSRFMDD